MKKLKIEELRVESFATTHASPLRGTVDAHESNPQDTNGCTPVICTWFADTCDETCRNTCPATCDMYVCSENPTCLLASPTCSIECVPPPPPED